MIFTTAVLRMADKNDDYAKRLIERLPRRLQVPGKVCVTDDGWCGGMESIAVPSGNQKDGGESRGESAKNEE